jgi:protein-S-isoprenylcysteine O-methyltransferase Ste14
MHLVDQRILGFGVLSLLAMMVVVKRLATGSILDRPTGNFLIQSVNIFNLFFLLVVNPLVALALIARGLDVIDPTHIHILVPGALLALEIAGLILYVAGFLLMAWALITLSRNYQLGGSAPRADDMFVVRGPYGWIRHPMYAAALSIALGLACLVQSLASLVVFLVYFVLILLLIPLEEARLLQAYDRAYAAYREKVSRLIPFVF